MDAHSVCQPLSFDLHKSPALSCCSWASRGRLGCVPSAVALNCVVYHQRALGEFPEKELQLQQMEIQAQRVFERTSTDGQVHGQRDLERLRESWLEVYNISLNLHRYQTLASTVQGRHGQLALVSKPVRARGGVFTVPRLSGAPSTWPRDRGCLIREGS